VITAPVLLLTTLATAETNRAEYLQDNQVGSIDVGFSQRACLYGPSRRGPVDELGSCGFLNLVRAPDLQPTTYPAGPRNPIDHRPAVGTVIEASLAKLYASVAVTSVRLPGDATAEIALSYGVRPNLSNVDFDLSWNSR
jgi:hypothetical protein